MQFVTDQTTFQADDEIDREFLSAFEPLGVVPGHNFDPAQFATIDGERLREVAEGVPDDNWLPLVRGDYASDAVMRIYAPDVERFAEWTPPVAGKLE